MSNIISPLLNKKVFFIIYVYTRRSCNMYKKYNITELLNDNFDNDSKYQNVQALFLYYDGLRIAHDNDFKKFFIDAIKDLQELGYDCGEVNNVTFNNDNLDSVVAVKSLMKVLQWLKEHQNLDPSKFELEIFYKM